MDEGDGQRQVRPSKQSPKHQSLVSGNSYSMRSPGGLRGRGRETVPSTGRLNSRPRITFASRFACLPLYSHAKQPRFETSAWPSPPVSFRAPCLKQYQPPAGPALVGIGSPSGRQGAMKCDCAAQGSFNSDARHLAMNSPGVIVAGICAYALRAPSYTRPRTDDFHARFRRSLARSAWRRPCLGSVRWPQFDNPIAR